ncbi:site-specific integrase [Faecalibacter macacae]|uniref:Site-specific integrase n=1 Tax=Faecalibacter macacae TaxID=1859289 RepID=A0A3L9M9F6_9FLAO|nr:site-specific integrase [Faecalibacter macacae]RLZ07159.1 site-specific integrase [Faecalibacter macacae]
MKNNFKIHVYPRQAKANKLGQQPIYFCVRVNGKRWEFSTKQYIDPKTWDAKNSKIKGNNKTASTINAQVEITKSKINTIFLEYNFKNETLTIDTLKEEIQGKTNKNKRTLIPIFQNHNKQMKALVPKEYSPGTLERYETSLRHTQNFIKHQYKKEDISLDEINHAFIMDYDFYLRTERNCSNNTTIKYLKNFKKIINLCIANDWIQRDPFTNYKSKLDKIERIFLSTEEIQSIYNKEYTTDRLTLVKDIFIFSCFTGLAYIDIVNLTKNNIVKGIDGQLWIHTYRQKTSTPTKIPLLEIPLAILEKYKDNPICATGKLLPIYSNQKMNEYLKEITAITKINKDLTFHCARHTFATTVTLSNGVPIESVSKMLGHTNIKTTQHYARITEQKISNDMQNLKQVIENKSIINKNAI